MDVSGKNLAIAVTLTVLDLVVALRYGPAIWHAGSGVVWCRLLLILLAAVWATSLANIWYRARLIFGKAPRPRRVRLSEIMNTTEREGADV